MTKTRHVLGISGGKDSAALAIYMKDRYPALDIEYYFCDTGKELEETYDVIKKLEVYLGKNIVTLTAAGDSHISPFDHIIKYKGQFLPSMINRWCTRDLKLVPFEKWIGDDPVISYVGIRGDEDREGYISQKTTIQSIFPFRKNIWSEDVIKLVISNDRIGQVTELFKIHASEEKLQRILQIVAEPISLKYTQSEKLSHLLSYDIKAFNKVVHQFLKDTKYPVATISDYPLVENEDVLIRDDIFNILRNSGVGVPEYYEKVNFEVDGQTGQYARSRSGCYFCFYQQRIEWVWLYEQHPDLFMQAMEYEKDGYYWSQKEPLAELIKPERIAQIKREYLKRTGSEEIKSPYLIDMLDDAEGSGCAACFI